MKRFLPLLFLGFFCFFSNSAYLQTVCPEPATPAINDTDPGCTICDFPYTGTTAGGYTAGPVASMSYPGCSGYTFTVQNDQYFIFIANQNCVTFTIDPSNCQNGAGSGLQGLIFDLALNNAFRCGDDCDFSAPFNPNPAPFTLSTCGLIAGEAYYLVIDGCGTSECDFTVNSTGTQGGDFVSITPDPVGPFCISDPITTLVGSPATGANGNGVWSGDVNSNGDIDPSSLGPGNFEATYTYTNQWGCEDEATVTWTVLPGPNVTIDPVDPLCDDEPQITLTATPSGGVWAPSNVFDPAASGAGSHTITYTYTSPIDGCITEETILIVVVEDPVVSFDSPTQYCASDDPVVLEGDPPGGEWGGAADINGNFDPGAVGPGTYTVTYEYSEPIADCTSDLTQQITVLPGASLSFSNLGPFCENEGSQFIIAMPPGGDWGGIAFSGGEIVPDITGFGIHDVTYEYTDANGCIVDTIFQIEILEPPFAEIDAIDDLCPYDMPVQMTASPSGGIWGGVANSTGVIDPVALGTGSHTVTYTVTSTNGCMFVAGFDVEINEDFDILFFNPGPFCLVDSMMELDVDPFGGDWDGAVGAFGEFNPALLGPGIHRAIYTYYYGSSCVVVDSIDFEILPAAGVDFSDSIFCQNTGLNTLTAMPAGGTWSGANITPSGQINTDTLDIGNFTVFYTVTVSGGGCDIVAALDVQIQGVDAEIVGDTAFCQTADTITFVGVPAGGSWSGVADTLGRVDPTVLALGAHSVFYTVTSANGCTRIVDQIINVTAPPTAMISGSGTICPGGNATTDLTITLTDSASWVINYNLDTVPQVPIMVDSSPFQFTVNQPGIYTLTSVADTFGCTNVATGMATVTELVPLTISNIRGQCDAFNTNFVLTFEISGGDPASYMVSGVNGTLSSSSPYIFTSENILSLTPVNYMVSDNSGCAPVIGNLTIDCSCETEIGQMDLTPINLCGTATAIYDPTGEFLGSDDVRQFVLHTSSGVSLGTVLEISNNPTFDFNGTTMVYGTTYYISAIAGNDDGTGNVDLLDNCLSVAQGTPVTWYEEPTATLVGSPSICPDSTATMQINLTGQSPWLVRYWNGTDTVDLNGITSNVFDLNVTPSVATTYELISVSDNFCTGNASGIQTVSLLDSPTISVPTTLCNGTGTSYTVSFTISGGDASSYIVSGVTGNINAGTFTSDPIASGLNYSGLVTDVNGCDPVPFSGIVVCDCKTEVGSFDGAPINICGDIPAMPVYDSTNEFLDPDDILRFYLHTEIDLLTGTIIAQNTIPEFDFDVSQMMYDITYFITAVVGNPDPVTGNDFNDPCLAVSGAAQVVFRQLPTILIAPDQTICEGDETTLTLEMTGQSPFDVMLSVGGNSIDLTGIDSGFEYKFNPIDDSNVTIISIRDGNGCENTSSSEATITVNTTPTAMVTSTAEVCNSSQSGDITTFDFSTLITGGDANGTWQPIGSIGTSGAFPILDFAGVTPGQYNFEYTTNSAQAPCIEQTYSVRITVRDCTCPSVTTTGAGPFCNDDAEINLADLTITSALGTWSITNSPAGSSAGISNNTFSGTGSVAGNYELTFTLDSPVAGCVDNSVQIVVLNAPPSAVVTTAADVCNSSQSGDVTTFDFSTLITNGDAGGIWADVDGSGATGTFPVLDFQNLNPDNYRFRYTTSSAQAPCDEVVYEIVMTIRDCTCPSVTTTGAGPFCNDDTEINLADLTITSDPGTWSITNSPAGSSASISTNTFSGTGSVAGNYELIFTLDSPVAGCADNSVQTIVLNAPPSAVVTPIAEVCNVTLLGDLTTFDFSTLITNGDAGGIWADVDGSGATGTFPVLDFQNLTPNNYRFRYTTNSAQAPCDEVTYEMVMTVRDCSCPSVTTAPAGPFCNDAAILDLNTITVTSEPGSWTITNAPQGSTATIVGNIFDANDSATGDYELTFTLSQMPLPGCDNSSTQTIRISQAVTAGIGSGTLRICNDGTALNLNEDLTGETPGGTWTDISANSAGNFFNNGILTTQSLPNGIYVFEYSVTTTAPCVDDSETITIEIDNPVNAGDLIQNLRLCEGLDSTINLFDVIENNDLGGIWTDISAIAAPTFNTSGTLTTNGLQNGIYRFQYALTSGGICPNDQVTVEIQMNETPVADAGEPLELNCDIDMVTLGGTNTSTGQNINYQWSGSSSIDDPTVPRPTVLEAATYTLRVSNSQTGCFSEDQVTVIQNGIQPVLNANSVEITCFGDNNGEIRLDNVAGGTPPFLYSLNGGAFSDTGVFQNLEPGDYTLIVEDAVGCRDELTFTISEPEELTVTLTTNLAASSNLILQGDSIQLQANITGVFDSIQWSPPEAFEPCDPETDPLGCITPWVSPDRITTYEVFVVDEKGCNDRSSVTVFVEKVRNVFIPSAFSPNDDGINDEFQIFTDSNVEEIKSFLVFDRWGNLIFEQSDFSPDDPSGRWDGRFRGKRMDPAVFAYFAQIEFTDGTVELFEGDVSLLK